MGEKAQGPSGPQRPKLIRLAGWDLRYRLDRRFSWSFIDSRRAALGRLTGRVVNFPSLDQRAAEIEIAAEGGIVRALLWEMPGDLELLLGRGWDEGLPAKGARLLRFAPASRKGAVSAGRR